MAQNDATHDDRTEPKRFDETVSADDLIEGDRIDKRLVARIPDQLGKPLRRSLGDEPDDPDAQLVVVTAMRDLDDVHSALLLDPDAETYIRAGRHDSNQAWTQAEADWTVREVGENVVVEEVDDLERPEDEQDMDAHEYVAEWVEILFADVRGHRGDAGYGDERELHGTTLKLNDYDGRKATATITLEDDE